MLNKLALGTAQLGSNYGIANKTGQPSQDVSAQIINSAVSSGIKYIDTARAYGNSEEVIGKSLEKIDKSGLIISTKLSPSILDNEPTEAEILANVDRSINESLAALRLKKLDILMLHRWNHFADKNGAVWKRLLYFQDQGIIEKLGVSISTPLEAIEALNQPEIEFIQIPFNILDWRFRSDALKNAIIKRPDVTVQVRSAFLQGILISTKRIWPKNTGADIDNIINQLEKFVLDFGRKNIADLCLAYLRSLDWIGNIVIGMETIGQLENNIELFGQPLLNSGQVEIVEKTFVNIPETLLNPALWVK